jgi:hypothetical protein
MKMREAGVTQPGQGGRHFPECTTLSGVQTYSENGEEGNEAREM